VVWQALPLFYLHYFVAHHPDQDLLTECPHFPSHCLAFVHDCSFLILPGCLYLNLTKLLPSIAALERLSAVNNPFLAAETSKIQQQKLANNPDRFTGAVLFLKGNFKQASRKTSPKSRLSFLVRLLYALLLADNLRKISWLGCRYPVMCISHVFSGHWLCECVCVSWNDSCIMAGTF
jgi:hypothetical protein